MERYPKMKDEGRYAVTDSWRSDPGPPNLKPGRWDTYADAVSEGLLSKYLLSGVDVIDTVTGKIVER